MDGFYFQKPIYFRLGGVEGRTGVCPTLHNGLGHDGHDPHSSIPSAISSCPHSLTQNKAGACSVGAGGNAEMHPASANRVCEAWDTAPGWVHGDASRNVSLDHHGCDEEEAPVTGWRGALSLDAMHSLLVGGN